MKGNYYINSRQNDIYSMIKQNNKLKSMHLKGDTYVGLNRINYGEHWVKTERIMSAICKEFGIHFYAFFQLVLPCKIIKTEEEKEIMLLCECDEDLLKSYREIRKEIEKVVCCGIHDLNQVFDKISGELYADIIHLTEEGSRVVAENIYEIIKEDLYAINKKRKEEN